MKSHEVPLIQAGATTSRGVARIMWPFPSGDCAWMPAIDVAAETESRDE